MATKVADLLVNIGADTSDLKKELKAVQRQLNYAFGREGMSTSRSAAIGITAVGAALAGVAVYAVKAGGELQNVQTAMTNMLGSADKADQMIKELQDFAAHTPFEFKDVTLASQKFLAFGFTAEQIIPTLTAVGDAAAGVGAGQDGVNRLTVALGQIAAKGKLASQEMMQVTELGIPAWQMLAQYLGTDVATAQDRVSRGMVDSQMALEALVGGMESRYAGMMDAQSKTVLGAWSNLMDGVEQTAMQAGLAISEALNLPEVFSTAGDALSEFASEIKNKGLKDALLDLVPPELQMAIMALAGAIVAVAIPALGSMAVAAWAAVAPLLPLIAAGAAVGAAVYAILNPVKTLQALLDVLGVSEEKAAAITQEFSEAIDAVTSVVSDAIDIMMGFGVLLGEAIEPFVTGAIDLFFDLQNGITTMSETVWNEISGMAENIGNAIGNVIDDFKNMAYNALPDWGRQVVDVIRSTVQAALAWLDQLLDRARQAGKSLRYLPGGSGAPEIPGSKAPVKTPDFSNFGRSGGADTAGTGGKGGGGRGRQVDPAREEARRRAAAERAARSEVGMLRKVQDAMRDSIALQMNYATAAERAAYMVELDHEEAVEDIRRQWQAFEIEYIGMSDAERQRLTENFTAQGVAFEVMENGKLSLAKQVAKDIAAAEQQYAEETANFYIQCKDLMAAKDEAFRQNSWEALQKLLTQENAARINAYNTQQNAMQRYYENWLQTHKTTNELMADSILESQGAFETFFTNILKGQKNFGDAFMDLLNGLLDAIVKSIAETMAAQVVNQFLKWIMPGFFNGGGLVSGGFNTYGAASNALGIRLGSFASGGMISGPGTGTSDSIPAMLSNGEYVINAEAVRRIGVPRLNALNSGIMPHFAGGGYVGSGSYGNGMPPVVINLHNETGMAMEAEQTGSAFDGERWVLGVVLKGITNNTMGLRSMLQGGKA
jgi:tape measure domain-containing protein